MANGPGAVVVALPSRSAVFPGPELTVIVPTLNEEGNITPLVEKLGAVLHGIDWEVVFVDDDSCDATRLVIQGLARLDARVRLLHRIGRRGLSSACIEGVQASTAPLCGHHGCGPAARRGTPASHVGDTAEQRHRSRRRQPLYR